MKPVKGFEDYKVTKDGEVFDKNGRKLTVGRDNQGYATVTLRKDGKSYTRRLHRVVGETYLKPIEGKNIINHKDGDKSHCRLINLEYMSNSENTKHGYDNGFYRSRSKLPVIVIDKDGIESEFTSIRGLSRELGLNRKTVSSILNSGRKNNYDYTFRYKEASGMYRDYIEKLAKEKKKDSKKETVAKGVAGGSLLKGSKDKILGQKTLYHGTGKANVDTINQEGLKANRGGIGGASKTVGDEDYIKNSKGKVHLTGSKMKAKMYAGMTEAHDKVMNSPTGAKYKEVIKKYKGENGKPILNNLNELNEYSDASKKFHSKLYTEAMKKKNQGKVFKVKMDYNKYKKLQIDPDETGGAFMEEVGNNIKNKKLKGMAEGFARHQASRSTIDIGKNEIVGLHKASNRLKGTIKNMPNYIKTNKGRFGTGVAMAGLGTGLIASAMKNADLKRKEK